MSDDAPETATTVEPQTSEQLLLHLHLLLQTYTTIYPNPFVLPIVCEEKIETRGKPEQRANRPDKHQLLSLRGEFCLRPARTTPNTLELTCLRACRGIRIKDICVREVDAKVLIGSLLVDDLELVSLLEAQVAVMLGLIAVYGHHQVV